MSIIEAQLLWGYAAGRVKRITPVGIPLPRSTTDTTTSPSRVYTLTVHESVEAQPPLLHADPAFTAAHYQVVQHCQVQ